VGESVTENGTVENLEALFRVAADYNVPVFISPHYYFPHDHDWKFEGALEHLMHDIKMFDRPGPLDTASLNGSGADWLEQYKPYISKGNVVVTSPHKVYGPESNDLVLQLRKNGIDKVILGGMYGGVFTATEAAAVGALAALAIATLAYRQLGPRQLLDAARETVRTTSMLFLVLIGAALFSHVLTLMRLPAELVAAVSGAGVSVLGFLLVVMAVVFLLGMFLETIAIILITTPIVLPVLEALAIDPVWYGVLLMINLELALITPPVGMNLFVIKGVAEAPLGQVVRGAAPYVGLMLLALVVLLLVPGLALWLPGTMRG